jgi:hypothetical protein
MNLTTVAVCVGGGVLAPALVEGEQEISIPITKTNVTMDICFSLVFTGIPFLYIARY